MSQPTPDQGSHNQPFNDQTSPKVKYLSWWIENTLENRIPATQAALNMVFTTLTPSVVKTELGSSIRDLLKPAERQLLQSAEEAHSINNHLGGAAGIEIGKYINLLETALESLNKGIAEAVNGIKNALNLVEEHIKAVDETITALEEEENSPTSWFRIPRWLKPLFFYREDTTQDPASIRSEVNKLSPATLTQLAETLSSAYEKACVASEGNFASIHRVDVVNVLYESMVRSRDGYYSPTSD